MGTAPHNCGVHNVRLGYIEPSTTVINPTLQHETPLLGVDPCLFKLS